MVTKYFELVFSGSIETKRVKPRQRADNNPAYKIYLHNEVQCLGHENYLRNLSRIYMYIYIYIYVCVCVCVCVYTYTPWDSKINRLKFLFPQDGYSVPMKAFHFLNAPPFCDTLFSLFKRAFNPKFSAKVSDFNGLHFLIILSLAISITIRYFHWKCNIIIIIVIIFTSSFFLPKAYKA